jgi:hypothetical protein
MPKIIEIPCQFPPDTASWLEFYVDLESKMISELKKNGLNPENMLFRGIKYADLQRLVKTGCDLLDTHEIYAASIKDGQHNIRTALERGYMKKSKPLIFKGSNNNFVVSCYRKDFFQKKEFVQNDKYNNYDWVLKDKADYKDALQTIFVFKPRSQNK